MRRIALTVVFVFLCNGFAESAFAQKQSRKVEPIIELRVLTYNMHAGKGRDGKLDLKGIAEVIKSTQPHLVALQEVDCKTRRSGKVDQAQELAKFLKMDFAFGKAIDFQGGQYGNAILAAREILVSNEIVVSSTGAEHRSAVGAAIKTDEKNLVTLISTHFDHRDVKARKNAAAVLAKIVQKSETPVIIAGDLNCEWDDDELKALKEVVNVPSPKPTFTFPAAKPTKQIDFILVDRKSNWDLVSLETVEDGGVSDHRPLLAVFKLDQAKDKNKE